MANNTIDLKYLVNYDQLKAANAEVLKVGSSAQKSASVFEQAFRKVESANNKSLTAVRQKIAFSKRMEAQKAKEARVTQQAANQEAKALERLRQKYDQSYVAMDIYLRERNDIDMAHERGVLSADQQRAALERLNVATQNGTVVSSEFGSVSGQMGRRMSRSGVMVQQAGYQVGDFIVQAQSGQNILVAFGQQATQMAGTLTMLGGKFIGIGTVLGVAIPLATALGAAFMRTRGEVDESGSAIKDFGERIKSAREETDDLAESLRLLRSGFKEKSQLAYSDAIEKASSRLELAKKELEDFYKLGTNETLDETVLKEQVGLAEKKLALAIEEAKSHDGLSSSVSKEKRDQSIINQLHEVRQDQQRESRKEAEKYKDLVAKTKIGQEQQFEILKRINSFGKDSVAVAKLRAEQEAKNLGLSKEDLRLYVYRALAIRSIKLAIKSKTEAQKKFNEEAKKANEEAKKAKESALEQETNLNREIALLTMIEKFGEDSLAVQRLQKQQAIAIYEEELKRLNLNPSMIAGLLEQKSVAIDLSNALSNAADAAARAVANLETARSFGSLADGEFSDVPTGLDPFGGGGDYRYDLPSKIKPPKGKKGKGGGSGEKDPLAKLRKRIELDTKLLDKNKERQEVERLIAESRDKYSEKAINQAVAELEAYNNIVDKRRQIDDLFGVAQSTMEDGFMAMVEGTKSVEDAFKDMARQVIAELYRVLVVQRMVGSFSAGTGILGMVGGIFGGGAAGGGGKASGGTVMSGTPYLVGEKGPELIVPQNRGHVMNADLTSKAMGDSGGTVVVNQNFNFQANGDESVKKIIAQAAPSIANMAKQSVIDARRRGGAMKNTFG